MDQSLDRSKGGLGIGLTLVKSLAEMHGGSVLAASAGAGLGSEFTLWLPLSREIAEPARNESRTAAEHGRRATAPDSRRRGQRRTRRPASASCSPPAALTVQIAPDGKTGISLARSFRPEVVLLDIGLPGMTGYEVVGAVSRAPRAPRPAP